ncbi:phosphoribosylamine-glycine ligase [Mytilinidion resinicola]|uniref:phosphoribosylamine--glycine ligase n=1 Tax=Mytilinidion resinicola TaxID=574789 RepID=A0A6A6YKU8_9PEZI|nr:phosphoribosylamine-glycine ligase [Mytilinidion resinicola]KAF2808497.1 phosphoribosylamine-glycine ligase [Mytilinidion resinicola]
MTSSLAKQFNVLLVGKGAREHALAWKLSRSPSVKHFYVVPGNGGAAALQNVSNIEHVAANDYQKLVSLSKQHEVGLVVVGPDDAIMDRIEGGVPCFAPSKEAAGIEGSKTYAKDFMRRHGIPTAEYRSFEDGDAQAYLNDESTNSRVVIKVDGLASGKGVVLPVDRAEAHQALKDMMLGGKFSSAGNSVVIEDYLDGDEISVLTLSDGRTSKSFPLGQDHKRIYYSNKGPNTGGTGVNAPVPFVSSKQMAEIERKILQPTFEGLEAEGRTFVGMLFTGIMLASSGPKVLEYNARFGDPETQTMMMLLSDDDFAAILLACAQGKLHQVELNITPGFSCNVVIEAGGYPEEYCKGDVITLSDCPPGVQDFHAGTQYEDGVLKTAGGRVFSVAARGETLEEAVATAYQGVESIQFEGMFYRKDIAAR